MWWLGPWQRLAQVNGAPPPAGASLRLEVLVVICEADEPRAALPVTT